MAEGRSHGGGERSRPEREAGTGTEPWRGAYHFRDVIILS